LTIVATIPGDYRLEGGKLRLTFGSNVNKVEVIRVSYYPWIGEEFNTSGLEVLFVEGNRDGVRVESE